MKLFRNIIVSILLAVFTLSLCACSAKNDMPEEMPEDFSFFLSWGQSTYDSATGRLVKTTHVYEHAPEDYICTLIFSDEKTAEIYDVLRDMNPANYPENYDPHPNSMRDPQSALTLTVRYDGKEKTISCKDVIFPSKTFPQLDPNYGKKGRKFVDALLYLMNSIYSTDEWQALPDYEVYYN